MDRKVKGARSLDFLYVNYQFLALTYSKYEKSTPVKYILTVSQDCTPLKQQSA